MSFDFDKLAAALRTNGFTEEEAQLRLAIARLTPREEQIIRLRYGVDEEKPMVYDEVGRRFAVTRERIRQIEKKALAQLSPEDALEVQEQLAAIRDAHHERRRAAENAQA